MRYLLIFSFFVIYFSCNKPNCDNQTFILPVIFSPPDSIIQLGDTITVISQFPNILQSKYGEDFLFDSINFYIGSGVSKIDTFNGSNITSRTFDICEVIIDEEKYNYIKYNLGFGVDYYYSGKEYFVEFKLVPKVKGVFYFDFFSLRTFPDNDNYDKQFIHYTKTDCETDKWFPRMITNNGEGNNRELLKFSPDIQFNQYYYDNWHSVYQNSGSGAHCFKVE